MTTKLLDIESLTPEDLARLAGLSYVTDEEAGFARERNGVGFFYVNGSERRLRDRVSLNRIESLAIPPAWADVWICRTANGHLQVTGHDARQRKQYIYHERWREMSNLKKFWRLKQCAQFLPELRARVARDLRGRSLTRNRVLAGMVALLDLTSIRVGNEEYVRQNNSYGLTTLRNRHVTIEGQQAKLRFRGKSGLQRETIIQDKRLVRLLKELKKIRGAHVFQFVDSDGKIHSADANAVNDYLQERTTHAFTAKDFRTWKASAIAAAMLYDIRNEERSTVRKRLTNKTVAAVAAVLGNTTSVCRKYYIHSGLLDASVKGELADLFQRYRRRPQRGLSPDEQLLAHFLRRWPRPK